MEKHRAAWLGLALALSGVASALLARADTDGYSAIFYGASALCFILGIRQVRFPGLRGSEPALLYRDLKKMYSRIDALSNPTQEQADEIAAETLASYRKYVPHYLQDVQGAIDRATDQGPSVMLTYLNQGIRSTLERLEMGGGV